MTYLHNFIYLDGFLMPEQHVLHGWYFCMRVYKRHFPSRPDIPLSTASLICLEYIQSVRFPIGRMIDLSELSDIYRTGDTKYTLQFPTSYRVNCSVHKKEGI